MFTKNLLQGESVYLEYGQERTGKFGRLLAYLYRAPDGLFVNLEIVRQGYGHVYTKYPFKYLELFREYGKKAAESGRGLWAASYVPPSEIIIPTGTVETPVPPATRQITVYVTKTGKQYHRAGCRYLKRSKISIPLDQAKSTYTACSVCRP